MISDLCEIHVIFFLDLTVYSITRNDGVCDWRLLSGQLLGISIKPQTHQSNYILVCSSCALEGLSFPTPPFERLPRPSYFPSLFLFLTSSGRLLLTLGGLFCTPAQDDRACFSRLPHLRATHTYLKFNPLWPSPSTENSFRSRRNSLRVLS